MGRRQNRGRAVPCSKYKKPPLAPSHQTAFTLLITPCCRSTDRRSHEEHTAEDAGRPGVRAGCMCRCHARKRLQPGEGNKYTFKKKERSYLRLSLGCCTDKNNPSLLESRGEAVMQVGFR